MTPKLPPEPGPLPWLPHPLFAFALPICCAVTAHLVGLHWAYGSLAGSGVLLVWLRISRWRMERWRLRMREWEAGLVAAGIVTQTEIDGLRNMHRGM
jgi:hypothetical protein